MLLKEVISRLNNDFVLNLCLIILLQIYTFQKSENDKDYVLLTVAIRLGKKIVSFYLNYEKDLYISKMNTENKNMLYSEFKIMWEKDNPELANKIDDEFYAQLGCMIIAILEHTDMITKELRKTCDKKHEYVLKIADNK